MRIKYRVEAWGSMVVFQCTDIDPVVLGKLSFETTQKSMLGCNISVASCNTVAIDGNLDKIWVRGSNVSATCTLKYFDSIYKANEAVKKIHLAIRETVLICNSWNEPLITIPPAMENYPSQMEY
jgi:hypothetical protein